MWLVFLFQCMNNIVILFPKRETGPGLWKTFPFPFQTKFVSSLRELFPPRALLPSTSQFSFYSSLLSPSNCTIWSLGFPLPHALFLPQVTVVLFTPLRFIDGMCCYRTNSAFDSISGMSLIVLSFYCSLLSNPSLILIDDCNATLHLFRNRCQRFP